MSYDRVLKTRPQNRFFVVNNLYEKKRLESMLKFFFFNVKIMLVILALQKNGSEAAFLKRGHRT